MVVPTTIAVQAELAGAGGGWTDISKDVNMGVEPISIDYGIRGAGPLDRIASTGIMSWAMNNSARNSGSLLGYYTPGHANARSGWEIGITVRLVITYGGTIYYKFRGTLVSVQPDPGINRRRAVICTAHDWMAEAAGSYLRDTAIQTSKRADQIISTVVTNSATRQPAATSYAVGQSTFAFALDNLRDERSLLIRAMADAVYSEVGYLYVKGDTIQGGTLRFEDRHARPLKASSATFSGTMFDIEASRSRDDIINHIIAMIHPRQVDAAATTVLYQLTSTETVPAIAPGGAISMTGFFRDATGRFARVGGDSLVSPVAGTDYIGNSAADGSGSVLTSDLSLVFSSTSNSATFVFTNNGASTVYLTTLQVRGKAVQDRYELAVTSHNTTSETKFGERDLTYDMIFEANVTTAKGVAEWFTNLYGDVRTVVSEMSIKPNTNDTLMTQALAREPGDKITLTESMIGVSAVGYFINGVSMLIKSGKLIDVNWVLAPASQQQAWILEDAVAGLLGTSTYMGYV